MHCLRRCRRTGRRTALPSSPLPVRSVERDVFRDLAFPAVAVREQTLLVIIELFARLGREFEIWAFDDGINRTSFLTEPAIDALHHVDVVTRRAAGAVVPTGTGLDRDRLGRANGLAELAGDAAFLSIRIASQGMLAAETRRNGSLLERIIERGLRLEEVAHGQHETGHELHQEKAFGREIEPHGILISRSLAPARRIG